MTITQKQEIKVPADNWRRAITRHHHLHDARRAAPAACLLPITTSVSFPYFLRYLSPLCLPPIL